MSAGQRVTLTGVLEHTASAAYIAPDGTLVVELYDFSPAAHRCLGNDVAFLLHVAVSEKERLLSGLLGDQPSAENDGDGDAALLRLLAARLCDYYAVKAWLDQHGIAYRSEFEPWA